MKSRFFTDTQGFDPASPPSDKICVCLCLNRQAYEMALREAQRHGITSGEYMDHLLLCQPISACGRAARQQPDSPPPCFPPARPGH